jgi:hypothetical protein
MAQDAQPPPEKLSPEKRKSRLLTPIFGRSGPLFSIDEVLAEVRKRIAVERMLSCPEFEKDPNSLQARLLKFYKVKGWIKNTAGELQKAEESRKDAFRKAKKEQILGIHPRGGLAKDYDYVFRPDTSPNELFELNRALLSDDPGNALSRPEVVSIIARKFSLGAGDAVIRFLAARLEAYHPAAKDSTEPMKGPVFNRALLFAAEHWTDPAQPLWLMPGAAPAKIISAKINKDFSRVACNTMVRTHKLHRMDESIWGLLAALKDGGDEESRSLRDDFERAMGVPLAKVRRGRGARRQVE